LLSVAACLAPSPAAAADDAADLEEVEIMRVPITIHVASADGRSVISERQILASVRRANRELAPFAIHLVVRAIEPMQGGEHVETTSERFALARRAARDGSVHVFFVDRLRLQHERKGDRRVSGMHWRYHGLSRDLPTREYLAVAHNAPSTTLVHEIGHAFGLAHDKDRTNLMCSCRRSLEPAFTERQGQRLRSGARRFLRRARR
jgi:hypothetical protein